jgi:8-amino-7-oxononanoate synthase
VQLKHKLRNSADECIETPSLVADTIGSMPNSLDWLDDALANLDRLDLRRELKARTSPQRGDRIEIDGQSHVNFGSNDYLGLASDPRIAAAVCNAIDKYGWGSGASPLVSGRSGLHSDLEKKLAEFIGTEAALLFPSGYAANVGAITALVGKGDAIYSDELNHASIIDGCRLSRAAIHIYPHVNIEKLTELLQHSSQFRRRLIVTESLFSMSGDFAPLKAIAPLAEQFDAVLLVDEAHAVGIWGANGSGVSESDGVRERVPVRVGTLSKALGSNGGFVVGSRVLIDWLANRARTYGFSTATPAATAAAGLAALQILSCDAQCAKPLVELMINLRAQLLADHLIGIRQLSQIVPIVFGTPEKAIAAAAGLRKRGFFVPAIRPPSVPDGQSLLRISLTALHTEQQISDLVAALAKVAR